MTHHISISLPLSTSSIQSLIDQGMFPEEKLPGMFSKFSTKEGHLSLKGFTDILPYLSDSPESDKIKENERKNRGGNEGSDSDRNRKVDGDIVELNREKNLNNGNSQISKLKMELENKNNNKNTDSYEFKNKERINYIENYKNTDKNDDKNDDKYAKIDKDDRGNRDGRSNKDDKDDTDDADDEVSVERVFSELAGRRKIVTLESLSGWDLVAELLEDGTLNIDVSHRHQSSCS